MLLHKVDLRDHAMFSDHLHQLRFLEVPDWLLRPMSDADLSVAGIFIVAQKKGQESKALSA